MRLYKKKKKKETLYIRASRDAKMPVKKRNIHTETQLLDSRSSRSSV